MHDQVAQYADATLLKSTRQCMPVVGISVNNVLFKGGGREGGWGRSFERWGHGWGYC